MAQSFSVDDIQKMRTKLKSSKSYPNDFLRQQSQNRINENNEEGDNSSSGVSSDQEIQVNNNGTPEPKKTAVILKQEVKTPVVQVEPKPVKVTPVAPVTSTPTVIQQNLKPSLVKTTQPTSILKQTSTHINSSSNSLNNKNSISSTTTNNGINEQPKKVPAQFNTTPVTTRITNSIVSKMIPQVRSFVFDFGSNRY